MNDDKKIAMKKMNNERKMAMKEHSEVEYRLRLRLEMSILEKMDTLFLANVINIRRELEEYVKMQRMRSYNQPHYFSLESLWPDSKLEPDSWRQAFAQRLFEYPAELKYFFDMFHVRCSVWPKRRGAPNAEAEGEKILELLNSSPAWRPYQESTEAFATLLHRNLNLDNWEVFLKKTATSGSGLRDKFLEKTRDLIRDHMPPVSSEREPSMKCETEQQLCVILAMLGRLLAYNVERCSEQVHMRATTAGFSFSINEREFPDLLARHVLLESLGSRNRKAHIETLPPITPSAQRSH